MNTSELLNYAKKHNVEFTLDGPDIVINAPDGELTDGLLAHFKKNKPSLVKLIEAIQRACDGLSITPEQFRSLISEEDCKLIAEGKFEDHVLRAYAKSFAEGIASGRIKLFKEAI